MKKLLFIALAFFTLLIGIDARAQLVATAGFLSNSETENKSYASHLEGFYIGAKYQYPLDHVLTNLSIVPGVNLSVTGGSRSSIYSGAKVTELALNIPVMAAYTYRLNDMIQLFGQAGPTIQFGLSQNAAYKSSGFKTTLDCYQDNSNADARNRMNLFFGLGLGVEVYDQYQLLVGIDLGLLQMSSNPGMMSITRDLFHIGAGYRF